jgi:hypothetical protein
MVFPAFTSMSQKARPLAWQSRFCQLSEGLEGVSPGKELTPEAIIARKAA